MILDFYDNDRIMFIISNGLKMIKNEQILFISSFSIYFCRVLKCRKAGRVCKRMYINRKFKVHVP